MNINKRDFILFSNSIEEIDFNLVKKNLKLNSVVVLRGLVQKEEIYKAVKKLNMNFDRNNDNPTIGESPKDIQRNFQKLLVGGHTHSGLYLTRFFRTFYNPLWEEDIYLMHNIFKLMIKIRNRCINYPEDFAMERIEKNGLWSATRIHQYPTGGGYFAKHRDSVLTEVSKEKDLDFIQVIINMTKYGVDFQSGGAFVEINGEKIIFEKEFDIGDIICGRFTAFVSLYKDLKM